MDGFYAFGVADNVEQVIGADVFGCALHQDVQRLFEQAPAASSDQRGNEHTDERIRPFPAERHHKYGGGNRADRAEKVA